MSQINIITFDQMQPILRDAIENPDELGCVGFMSEPGIGKTQLFRQIVKKLGKVGNYFNAGMMTLGELSGCATPNKEFTHTMFLPLSHFRPEEPSLVDELTNAPDRGVFTGLSNFLVEGVIPGHPHTYNQARIYACNPPSTSQLAEDLPSIIINRGPLYLVKYESHNLIQFGINEGAGRFHPVVLAFIQETRDNFLHVKEFTPDKKFGVDLPGANNPFPSPRAYELLSSRLRRMERGLPTTVFDEAYATVGVEAGKKFGDFYAAYKYLPKVSEILTGKNEVFPEAAFKDGRVYGPLQMMAVFAILTAAETHDEFVAGAQWLFTQMKNKTVGSELLRTFTETAKTSLHSPYQHEVLNALGTKALGGTQWTQFLLGSLKGQREAQQV